VSKPKRSRSFASAASTSPQPPTPNPQPRERSGLRAGVYCLGLVLVVLCAYANHFQNYFHFDDFHAVVGNLFLRDLRNVPRFFADASMASSEPTGATYRPIVTASLAIDYWLGGGLKPFWFQLSTFLWFLVQLVLMFFLFRRIFDYADPHPSNLWTALFASACYGLQPANAETVNYIIQRAEVYSTLGVIASLLWFAAYPAQRRRGWYLLPAIAAYLSKQPALIFPLILLAYVFLFEEDAGRKNWAAALRATLPAIVVTAAAAILQSVMTPKTFNPGAISASMYRLTQPWVALHYFKSFFLPTELSADGDWGYVPGPFSGEAVAGYLFVAAMLAAAVITARRRETRPVSFGILWFFLALAPTSLMPLAEVANDHRMFFAFVGLVPAVFWSLRLLLFRQTARLTENRAWLRAGVAIVALAMTAAAAGTWQRNRVWESEESLWRDVALKSPGNARGAMQYALMLMNRGDYATGLPYLEHAATLNPYDYLPEMNLGVAYGAVGRDADAVRHFERSMTLAPHSWDPHYYYGRWLKDKGRLAESQAQLETAVRMNEKAFAARYLLMEIYSQQGNWQALDVLIPETFRLSKNDEVAQRYLAEREKRRQTMGTAPAVGTEPTVGSTPEAVLQSAVALGRAKQYEECIARAKQALAMRPNYAEAYHTMAVAYIALHRLDEGIQAASEAVRLKPDFELARKNLERARALKAAQ